MAQVTAIQPPAPSSVDVQHESAVGAARRSAVATAKALGFDLQACEEIGIAASELASNLLKHAGGGKLTLTRMALAERVGLRIEAQDGGPGIVDIERALTDGFSTTGSLGAGLGAVNRLMDEFDIASERGRGTRVVCCKWLRQYPPVLRPCPLAFGVATRSMFVGQPNGDDFVIKQWAGSALVALMDGLGHGPFAHQAGRTARQYVESHYDLPLAAIFRGTERACRATRGVVMALARFDWDRGRMAFGSVGNIEVRVLNHPESYSFHVRRGIVGVKGSKAVVTEHAWDPGNTLVLHSDGVTTHWSWKSFSRLADQSASAMAKHLLQTSAREKDDATVVVVRSAVV